MRFGYKTGRYLDDYGRLAGLVLRAIAGGIGRRLLRFEVR